MASIIKLYERIELHNPALVAGVPGMGLVANIVAAHLIRSLGAKKFGEVNSPFFQDIVLSTPSGSIRPPTIGLFYYKSGGDSDLIILYGNTQASTSYGQYELCGKILDMAQEMGCRLIACSGGLERESITGTPTVYFTATDLETLDMLVQHGLRVVRGQIFGISGMLPGLARIRGMKGFCILAETIGLRTDVAAAKAALEKLNLVLGLNVESTGLEKTMEKVNRDFALMKSQ